MNKQLMLFYKAPITLEVNRESIAKDSGNTIQSATKHLAKNTNEVYNGIVDAIAEKTSLSKKTADQTEKHL